MKMTRRTFVKQPVSLAAGATLFSIVPASVFGANDTIRIGVIGCGNRAQSDLMPEIFRFSEDENAFITAVCDVWRPNREKAAKAVQERYNREPAQYEDYRELLRESDTDAVVIATPEHQHIQILEAAIEAGKDVYCEKPLAMNMDELRRGVDTVKKSDRVVQLGTQLRSWPSFNGCRKAVREGRLGTLVKVMQVRNNFRPYWHSYAMPVEEKDTNWKLFLLNQKDRPFDPDQHSAWYGYRDFSLGPIASYFCHFIDLVHYITGADYPESAVALSGTYLYKDQRTVPDSVHALLDYPDRFMVSYCTAFGSGDGNYIRFFGTQGTLDATDWREPFLTGEGSEDPNRIPEKTPVEEVDTTPHMQNWLQCIRTRQKPNADIEAGYRHAVACLLANEALVHNRRMKFDSENRTIEPV